RAQIPFGLLVYTPASAPIQGKLRIGCNRAQNHQLPSGPQGIHETTSEITSIYSKGAPFSVPAPHGLPSGPLFAHSHLSLFDHSGLIGPAAVQLPDQLLVVELLGVLVGDHSPESVAAVGAVQGIDQIPNLERPVGKQLVVDLPPTVSA